MIPLMNITYMQTNICKIHIYYIYSTPFFLNF